MTRSAVLILLVVAVSAIVALGAGGGGLFESASGLSGGWLGAIRVGGACVAMAGFIGLMQEGRRMRANGDRDGDTIGSALGAATLLMAVLALTAALAPALRFSDSSALEGGPGQASAGGAGESSSGLGFLPPGAGGAGGTGTGRGANRPGGGGGDDLAAGDAVEGASGSAAGGALQRIANGLLLVLLFAAAVIGLRYLTGRAGFGRRRTFSAEPPVAAADAEAVLEASLGELALEGRDPRQQISVAYRRLLLALAAAGAPRFPQEAPHEYLYRALGPLGVRPSPMHRLTELYVAAQFSEHPVTEWHRDAAVRALETGLANIRAAMPAPATEPEPIAASA